MDKLVQKIYNTTSYIIDKAITFIFVFAWFVFAIENSIKFVEYKEK